MAFPETRLRRLRRTAELRNLVSETRLTPHAFVYPMFVCPGEGVRKEVRSMPGVFNLSVDEAVKEAQEVHSLGLPARPLPRIVIPLVRVIGQLLEVVDGLAVPRFHDADRVIADVGLYAGCLKDMTRYHDVVARLGGEEEGRPRLRGKRT